MTPIDYVPPFKPVVLRPLPEPKINPLLRLVLRFFEWLDTKFG